MTATPTPSLAGTTSVLAGAADSYAADLLAAIDAGDAQAFGAAHGTLASWCQFELVPALASFEQEVYPLAPVQATLLVQGLVGDHRVLAGLVDAINSATDAARLAGDATALRVLVRSTMTKVDELLVPAVAAADQAALTDAVEAATRSAAALSAEYAAAVAADVDASHARPEGGCGGGGCGGGGCGGGGCGSAAEDDHRSEEEKAAQRAAVSVTRVQ